MSSAGRYVWNSQQTNKVVPPETAPNSESHIDVEALLADVSGSLAFDEKEMHVMSEVEPVLFENANSNEGGSEKVTIEKFDENRFRELEVIFLSSQSSNIPHRLWAIKPVIKDCPKTFIRTHGFKHISGTIVVTLEDSVPRNMKDITHSFSATTYGQKVPCHNVQVTLIVGRLCF